MDKDIPFDELERNVTYDDQVGANNNPPPNEHAASSSRNGTADESRIGALNSDLSPPQAVTSSTEGRNTTQVEAPNHTPGENARQHLLEDEHPFRVEIQDEHPFREENQDEHPFREEDQDEHPFGEESNPMLDANAMYVAIVDQPPIEESGDEHDERHLIVSIMPL